MGSSSGFRFWAEVGLRFQDRSRDQILGLGSGWDLGRGSMLVLRPRSWSGSNYRMRVGLSFQTEIKNGFWDRDTGLGFEIGFKVETWDDS